MQESDCSALVFLLVSQVHAVRYLQLFLSNFSFQHSPAVEIAKVLCPKKLRELVENINPNISSYPSLAPTLHTHRRVPRCKIPPCPDISKSTWVLSPRDPDPTAAPSSTTGCISLSSLLCPSLPLQADGERTPDHPPSDLRNGGSRRQSPLQSL